MSFEFNAVDLTTCVRKPSELAACTEARRVYETYPQQCEFRKCVDDDGSDVKLS